MAPKDLAKKYRKLDHREHVLQRPHMYIGSVEQDACKTWVATAEGVVECKETTYVPGLYKIFDEILVNAVDHATRLRGDANALHQVKAIKVTIERESGFIEVWNDGDGIDVEVHPEHGVYIPELIFGHLLTSANYDDKEEKIIGGQNGIGAKACNVFSKHFVLETVDAKRKKLYTQHFRDNMSVREKPEVKSCAKKPFTRIRFLPDYPRFGCPKGLLTDDMYALLKKRVYDVCAVTQADVAVWLDGKKLEHKTFERYVDLYIGGRGESVRAYEKVDDRWEVVAALSDGGEFQQVSFVNGIWTLRGGKHVDYMCNQIVKKLADLIAKRKKETIKPQHIRDNLALFVKATIPNPTFDSQTKETLTTPYSKFGSKPEVSDKFVDKLYKTGIVEKAMVINSALESKSLKKTDGKKRSVIRNLVKLEDANYAGTARSHECTLILTEGDSAATMAMSGIDEVGRDRYGVFPLRGKLLNVKDCNIKRIIDNEEISNLKKIIGLETSKDYASTEALRYGKVMLLTDQDADGSHIKGLLFNLFQTLWPSLFKMNGFLISMLTPIIKAKKGARVLEFYTLTDFDNWKEQTRGESGWEIKYYKGLGTSNADEAREYFRQLKTLKYAYEPASSDESIDLAFNKKRADDRKAWLANYDRQSVIAFDRNAEITFEDFVNKDLIHFSNYDVKRSIPSMVDGLKVSQRKIMYACFVKKWAKECRVAQLSAFVSENSAYHHGEESLNNAIVGLAQDFVGSNNVNLLKPNGQFGSRIKGGKDSSSPRYIYTEVAPLTRYIFRKDDDRVLSFLDDDGYKVEPEHYMPIIPMVLINGATGIGTGFSTSIPCYNPREVIVCLRTMLSGGQPDFEGMRPWYRGYKGSIVHGDNGKFFSKGIVERMAPTKLRVKELPIGVWTEEFKETLESALDTKPWLKSYESHFTDVRVDFILNFASVEALDDLMACDDNGFTKLENELKLVSTRALGTTNMYLFNEKGQITKYTDLGEIFRAFYQVRLDGYVRRKKLLLSELEEKKVYLQAKIVFVNEIIEGSLLIHDQPKAAIEQQLRDKSYPVKDGGFDYLVSMPIYTFTREKKAKLQEELDQVMDAIRTLQKKSCEELWLEELDDLESKYNVEMHAFDAALDAKLGAAPKKRPNKKMA